VTSPLRLIVALVVAALAATVLPASPAGADDRSVPLTVHSDPQRDLVGALTAYARLMAVPSVDTGEIPDVRAPREGGGKACPPRRCRDIRVPAPRSVKVPATTTTRVLLPRGYDAPRNARTRYPVVFLWNGGKSSYTGWTFKSELTKMSRRWKAILVMPDGGFDQNAGFFSDWHDGSFDWETYHTQVLVPWVDRTFRTIKGARSAVGASMGGIGVFAYAAHHPDMFTGVLSISGAVDTTTMAVSGLDPALNGLLGTEDIDLRRIWGDPVLDRATWDAHNPTVLAPDLKGTQVLIASGTGFTSVQGDAVYSGNFEQSLWNTHRNFLLALTAAGVPYSARVATGGVHDWPYFNDPLRWGVPRLIERSLEARKR
jgi:diacylglycerol O-acyltransferase / trehalose O-mycolyltransferase